jgi:antitoxin component of MazEF toxin-antitoxin module
MTTLQVTADGHLTLQQELLRHLGVSSGGKVEAEQLPNGSVIIRAARRKRNVRELFDLLKDKGISLSLEEIEANTIRGWAGDENRG